MQSTTQQQSRGTHPVEPHGRRVDRLDHAEQHLRLKQCPRELWLLQEHLPGLPWVGLDERLHFGHDGEELRLGHAVDGCIDRLSGGDARGRRVKGWAVLLRCALLVHQQDTKYSNNNSIKSVGYTGSTYLAPPPWPSSSVWRPKFICEWCHFSIMQIAG